MGDDNFSRAFEVIEDDNDASDIQDAVYDAMASVDEFHSLPTDLEERLASHSRHDMPSVSSLVEISESSHQGRFAVAKEGIPCGSVISFDRPTASLLNPDDPKVLYTFRDYPATQYLVYNSRLSGHVRVLCALHEALPP